MIDVFRFSSIENERLMLMKVWIVHVCRGKKNSYNCELERVEIETEEKFDGNQIPYTKESEK